MISKKRGFTLIEVLISFLLLGVGALGLMRLQIYMERNSDYAMQSIEALQLAENQLESFRTRGASAAISTFTPITFDSISSGSSTHGAYFIEWEVPAAKVSGSLKTISIKSSWVDRMGETQSVELKTMISKYSEFD
ncbi:prepilin-type N-terminal cleavage/methylation domain-containing protein [Vibrio cholerae]|uniref:type IV pilus modification PilV family protein n=1 Tax=Vibrio cholerae TaxID=666 RepID=UPI0001D5AB0F|nr:MULTISPECIES: prepilin-type N-terminal cleavage/methylation domain-containing protein [Vibrio]EFH73404.1 tfp pilus assembly protein PilV [Vibrio cholerae RC385]EKF9420176.1 prepilin-type N-terminal cleavage/methylation domain-containing protein [Vibrio cholerae]QXC56852.1 prepilin-type N-terminal cleavage/methylation domain-containing protein [Vibrio mimicus]TXY71602.1 prepilin-type N-terminal cleavage/methylation domain-containing protein [Vibrio cholerae]GHW84024.1 putative type IV pilin 